MMFTTKTTLFGRSHLLAPIYQLITTPNIAKPIAQWRHNQQSTSNQSAATNRPDYKSIVVERLSEHVAHIKMNRPKKRNAINFLTCDELCDALQELEDNKELRCAILSGEGQDFTSGLDLSDTMDKFGNYAQIEDIGRRAKAIKQMIEKFQSPVKLMDRLSKPIICALQGNCIGMGMELAASCDIRYCSDDSNFAIREVRIGIAADVGSLQKMPLLMANQSFLRELIYTGRGMSSAEALKFGFVSKVFPDGQSTLEAATNMAVAISKLSPIAVQGSKVNLRFSADKSFDVGLEYAAVWNMAMMQSQDVPNAITSIVTKSDDTKYEPY